MPYIKEELRPQYSDILNLLPEIKTKGELEYVLYYILKLYMKHKPFKYSELHDTVYAAAHVSDEFRRNFLDVREDQAKTENGDI